MTTKHLPKARQLAGPTVRGAEGDTPLYHIDVDRDQLRDLVADPVGYLGKIGLGSAQGVAPGGAMRVTLGRGDIRWTGGGWQPAVDGEAATAWCCYVVGDETICHSH